MALTTNAEIVMSLRSRSVNTAEAAAADRRSIAERLESCPLCAGNALRTLPTPGHWIGEEIFSSGAASFGLDRCRTCSLTFVNPRPSSAMLNAFYDCATYVCHNPEAGSTSTAQFLLGCVERHGPYKGRRFLDFGCGAGFLLRAALEDNWNANGYDVGQRALASCAFHGLPAIGNLNEFTSGRFDVVFLNHVFEHIAEPETTLSQCRRLLSPQGKLFVVVPNLDSMRARLSFPFLSRRYRVDERHRAFPIHLFYFTPQTLSRTLEKNGFRVAAVETFGLGMDEFINRPEPAGNVERNNVFFTRKKKRALWQFVKQMFFSAGLGENLLVVSQPAP